MSGFRASAAASDAAVEENHCRGTSRQLASSVGQVNSCEIADDNRLTLADLVSTVTCLVETLFP